MRIVVCIKQVPAATEVRINPETNNLIREGTAGIINPYDMQALEEGLRVRERCGGKVAALSMGPPQVVEALREAISMGVDEGILISDRAFAGSDTLATSYTLSRGIAKLGSYDLVICGRQAIDGDTAQVGPQLSEFLGIPLIAYVRKIEEIKPGYLRVERVMDEGCDVIETSLPALITVNREINKPRLPSLRGQLRAKKAQITAWRQADLDLDPAKIGTPGSPTKVAKLFTPKPKGKGEMLTGSVAGMVDTLVAKLRNHRVV